MIAAVPQSMALNNLPFNWFDITVAVLGFGLWRGRKNGMTKEVMPSVPMAGAGPGVWNGLRSIAVDSNIEDAANGKTGKCPARLCHDGAGSVDGV